MRSVGIFYSDVVTSENIAAMMLQNMMFSSMIAKNLFAENEKEQENG